MWADVVALLQKQGLEAIAPELPTIGEDSAGADFYADARAIRELLDRLEPPVLLCGHSYGGAVITEAAAGPHPAYIRTGTLTSPNEMAPDQIERGMEAPFSTSCRYP